MTPATASYLSQTILVLAIVSVLVYHTFFQQHQTRERHALLFLAFFVTSTGLILLRLAGSILAPLVQLRATFIEPVVIAVMVTVPANTLAR
jgi:hypothetical protein